MQYSLRSLLISFAVAGTGAAVYCAKVFDPTPTAVTSLVVLIAGSALAGIVWCRKRNSLARGAVVLLPAAFITLLFTQIGLTNRFRIRHDNDTQAYFACDRIFAAESRYHAIDWEKDGDFEYAATLQELNSRGMIEKDFADAEWPSTKPYHGYFFKVLTRRKHPVSESYFNSENKMTNGWALVAWPANERTGIHQYQINECHMFWRSSRPLSEFRSDVMTECDPDSRNGWHSVNGGE